MNTGIVKKSPVTQRSNTEGRSFCVPSKQLLCLNFVFIYSFIFLFILHIRDTEPYLDCCLLTVVFISFCIHLQYYFNCAYEQFLCLHVVRRCTFCHYCIAETYRSIYLTTQVLQSEIQISIAVSLSHRETLTARLTPLTLG